MGRLFCTLLEALAIAGAAALVHQAGPRVAQECGGQRARAQRLLDCKDGAVTLLLTRTRTE